MRVEWGEGLGLAGKVQGKRMDQDRACQPRAARQAPGDEGRALCWCLERSPFSPQRCPGNGLRQQPPGPRSPGSPSGTGVLAHRERPLCCLGLWPRDHVGRPWLPILPPGWCLEGRPRAGSPDLSGAVLARGLTHVCALSGLGLSSLLVLLPEHFGTLQNILEHSGTFQNTLEHSGHGHTCL